MTTRPHDAIFKAAFESPEHAAAMFRSILPDRLRAAIAWDTLTREPGSFIDPRLADRHTDLLFSARIDDKKVLLYLLLEHQSTLDPDMLLRMLDYLVRVWEAYRKEHSNPLPLTLPFVVSHAPGGWTGPLSFHELFDPAPSSIPGLADFVPSFTIMLEDLAHLDNDELERRVLDVFPKLVLWVLRDARDTPRLLENLGYWADALREALEAPNGMEALAQLLRYIGLVAGEVHFEEFRAKLTQRVPKSEEVTVSFVEKLLQEGREEGREEGLEKGRLEGLAAMLEKQLTLKFGELSAEHAARVRAASSAELERYIERILGADTIEAVFAA